MSAEVGTSFNQVQSLFDQLLLVSALLFGFSFAVVLQLSTNKEAATAYTWTRRLYFVSLLLFVNATGSALILIMRTRNSLLHYVLPAPGDTDRAALAILNAPWVSFLLTSLAVSLILGMVLWMAGEECVRLRPCATCRLSTIALPTRTVAASSAPLRIAPWRARGWGACLMPTASAAISASASSVSRSEREGGRWQLFPPARIRAGSPRSVSSSSMSSLFASLRS
jgi:hypothetical protein